MCGTTTAAAGYTVTSVDYSLRSSASGLYWDGSGFNSASEVLFGASSSDGYATGFLTYVLRMSGTPASDERLLKAVAWLKANQRESGRWFTRSLHADGKHFISHAGTAFAIMAIAAAESDPVGAPTPRSN